LVPELLSVTIDGDKDVDIGSVVVVPPLLDPGNGLCKCSCCTCKESSVIVVNVRSQSFHPQAIDCICAAGGSLSISISFSDLVVASFESADDDGGGGGGGDSSEGAAEGGYNPDPNNNNKQSNYKNHCGL
jgi:hypothetical protein